MAGQRRRQQERGQPPQRRTGAVVPLVILGILALGGGVGYAAWDSHHGRADAALDTGSSGSAPGTATDDGDTQPSAAGAGASPRAKSSAAPGDVPASGTGRFSTAHASGHASGHGHVRRYKVEVEGGITLSPGDAAHEIEGILAAPRGWTADGHDAFQLVSSGNADFVIKIATPDTTDEICGSAGLLTHGEVNCDVGPTVVVNLKRWMLGSPEFAGPIHDYRALIINHEVGHRIGHGHEGCPGAGKPAPVMMQQIKGLHGCVANAWPYDAHGRYLQGPPA